MLWRRYPGVLLVSYNIMMVGTTSTVWRDHPDFVSFDRYGFPVVDTPGERLSLDLASADAREYLNSSPISNRFVETIYYPFQYCFTHDCNHFNSYLPLTNKSIRHKVLTWHCYVADL